MSEKRFSYNPFNGITITGFDLCHAEGINKRGHTKTYDEFIRAILHDGILYLRLYYPFPDIEEKTLSQIERASLILLKESIQAILALIKKHYDCIPIDIQYNVINARLQHTGIANV